MNYIITALYVEAEPIIKKWGLKKDSRFSKFSVFRNDLIFLILSGTGKIRSALSLAYCIRESILPTDVCINFGIAACFDKNLTLGSPFLIHKVKDIASQKEYFLDILFSHRFQEASIMTSDIPLEDPKGSRGELFKNPCLVDMEASGFIEASRLYFQSHKVGILKVISDYLEPKSLTPQKVSALMNDNLDSLETLIRSMNSIPEPKFQKLNPLEENWIYRISEQLRLSVSQVQTLKDNYLCLKYRDHSKCTSILNQFSGVMGFKTKEKNKELLNLILATINEDII